MIDVHLQVESNNNEYELQSNEEIVVGGGTNNYERLINKPSIENVELVGNKDFVDLGLRPLTNLEIEALLH